MGHRVRRNGLFDRCKGCEPVIAIEPLGIEGRLSWGYGALRAQGTHPVRVYGGAGHFGQPGPTDAPTMVDAAS